MMTIRPGLIRPVAFPRDTLALLLFNVLDLFAKLLNLFLH